MEMSLTDGRGVPVSTRNTASLERFERTLHLLNGFYNDPLAEIDSALAEDPGFVLGHCFRAALMILATDKAAEPELRRSVAAAEALAPRANERERGHIIAARAWLDGDFHRAVELYGRVLVDHPRDLLALQVAHAGDFFTGQSIMLRDRVAHVLPAWSEDVPGYGFVLGMHAFGLEENAQFRRAEATGRRALELSARDPWAVHAVAHVMEMEGRAEEGIAWLRGRSADWAPDNGFAFHNWWHLALFHLELGEAGEVIELYDEAIRPAPSSVVLEAIDATAMLWRLHLRGIDAGPRWTELADFWEERAEDAYYAFNDMHAMMAFAATRRAPAMARLLAALERRAAGHGSNAAMSRDVGLPIARALEAFGRGAWDTAIDLLLPVRPIAQHFGGSNAQRDAIALTLLEAALRAGRGMLARALATERTGAKPASPLAWGLTARALDRTGEEHRAHVARRRAAALAAQRVAAPAA
jgi:tetratricopeptide (TPR) repeat protein